MLRRITQKNQPPRPRGLKLALLIILVLLSITLVFMFMSGMGTPTGAQAAEGSSFTGAPQRLPYLLYNYSTQAELLAPTTELTPTTVLTDGVSLQPGMTLDASYPPQVSTKVGDVGEYSAEYYLGVIEIVDRETVWPYWHVRLYAGTDKFDGFMTESAIYSAVTGKPAFILPQALYRVQVKPDTRVNVRLSPDDGQIVGLIANRDVEYGVIGYTTRNQRLWLQLRNPELGGWSIAFVAADFFDRVQALAAPVPMDAKFIKLNTVKTEGQAVRVRSAAGTASEVAGRISHADVQYQTLGGVQLGNQYWHKITNPLYKAGDKDNGWKEGYVLSDYFVDL